jgi:hypothetical protein
MESPEPFWRPCHHASGHVLRLFAGNFQTILKIVLHYSFFMVMMLAAMYYPQTQREEK